MDKSGASSIEIDFKNIKNVQPIYMDVFRRQMSNIRSANVVWHIGSTHELVKHMFVASVAVDGHTRRVMWLKHSNHN